MNCQLPANYAKRGFNKDDFVTIRVSVDNLNWINLGSLVIS
jgi:hypothetical protein